MPLDVVAPEQELPTAPKNFPAGGKLQPPEAADDIASGATGRRADNIAANG